MTVVWGRAAAGTITAGRGVPGPVYCGQTRGSLQAKLQKEEVGENLNVLHSLLTEISH